MRPRFDPRDHRDCSALELGTFRSAPAADLFNFCRGGHSERQRRGGLFRNLFNLRHNRLKCRCKEETVDCIFSYLR